MSLKSSLGNLKIKLILKKQKSLFIASFNKHLNEILEPEYKARKRVR